MKNKFIFILGLIVIMTASCASNPKHASIPITAMQNGTFTGEQISFPLYITNKSISKDEVKKEMGEDALLIYQGFILDAKKTKEENLSALALIKLNQYDLVNLNLQDLLIAKTQDINLDGTGLNFINTSIEDVKVDNIYRTKKVTPYAIYKDVIILGLSNPTVSSELNNTDIINEFHISDYTLSILKTRKEISLLTVPDIKNKKKKVQLPVSSFIIIHDLGKEIEEVTSRLPPYFMNY